VDITLAVARRDQGAEYLPGRKPRLLQAGRAAGGPADQKQTEAADDNLRTFLEKGAL
jgi:hypothetical protein